jgi:hypothetical protein
MYINDLFNESDEMNTPEFRDALLALEKLAAQEPPVDLKRLRQRMDAADRAEQAREKRKQERRAEVDENAWSDGSNSWSSEHDQWTKENSNNPMPIDSASAIPGRVREGAGVFNIGDQVLYKGQPAEVLAVDGTAATVYVPNWKAVPGMVDDTMEVDPASKFLDPMDPSVAEAKHQPRWEVEQHTNGHHNAFYLVKGHDRPREVWKDAQGRSDFKNRAAAEAKAAELNSQEMTEDAFQTQQLIQRHADMLGRSAAQLTQGDLDQLTQLGFSIGIGAAAGVAGVIGGYELGDRFISLINKTIRMIKKKAEVDTEEIIKLQRQIVSIHKRLKTLKSEPAIAKYQAMLKQAYEVLEELEARRGNRVAEAFQDDGKMDWDAWKQKAKQHGAVKFVDTDNKTIAYDKNSKQVSSITWSSKKKGVAEGSLKEFAPVGSNDGNDGFSDDTLKLLAAQWYNGDEDPKVEQTLLAAGWEIGQDEGYDDEPGVFVVQAGDINGNSYMSWPADELRQGVAEGKGLAKKVKIVRGPDAGKTGWIREIKHGAFKGAAKSYYIDLDDGGQVNNVPGTALRLVKDSGMAEGKWNYPPEYTKKANADDEAELGVSLINKDARKAWRKKQKAKAHKDLMTGKKKEPGVSEAKHQPQWTVEQHTNGHHNAFYIVRGYDRPRDLWKDVRGMSDFRSRAAAEAKAAELNSSAKPSLAETSPEKASRYLAAVIDQQTDKLGGIRPDMFGKIEKTFGPKGKQRKAGVGRAMDRMMKPSKVDEVTGDLPFDTMLSKIVAGGNLQTLAAKIVAKIKKFPQHVENDGYERDMPRYPDGHFYGADVLNDTFGEVMQQWKKMGPDNFSDEYGEESLFDVLDGSADYTRYWDGILKLRNRLQSMPGALEQLGKMVWHGLFSGSVEQGITDIGKKGVAEGELTAYQKLLKQMRQTAKNDPNRIPRGYELTAHGELVKKHKTEKSNDGVGGLGEGVAKAAKQKTPGVALSKAYRKDFDGKKPGHDRPETALTGAYSKTGKPGGALKKAGVGESILTANTPDPIVVVQDRKGNILDTVNLSAAVQKYRLGNAQNIKNQLAHQNYTTIGNYVVMAPMGGQPQDKTTQGIAENTNYWHKLQAERNTRINSLITELKESIK